MDKSFLSLEKISAFSIANDLSDTVWEIVSSWDWFSKKTIGAQFIQSIDSIAANIAEGFGRYHKKDKQKFFYNARGSVYEALFWTEKASKRTLFTQSQQRVIEGTLKKLPKDINWLIKITEEKLKI